MINPQPDERWHYHSAGKPVTVVSVVDGKVSYSYDGSQHVFCRPMDSFLQFFRRLV